MEAPGQTTYERLSATDRRLVDTYLGNGMVQWKAYRDVIYTGEKDSKKGREYCRTMSSRKFADVNIKAAIEERLKAEAMTTDEALRLLADQARNTFAQYIDEEGRVDIGQMIEDGNAHLIREVDYKGKDADRMVVRSHDVQGALDKILRAHGAYGAKGTEDDPAVVRIIIADGPEDP